MSSLVVQAVRNLSTAAADRRSRASLITTIALALIAIQIAFRAWAIYGGWFYGDDLIFLSDVAQGKSSHLMWYFHRHNVHFMPVGFVLVAIVGKMGTFDWAAAATELIILQAIASLCCWWMLRTLFGNRPLILVPLVFYLFSAISIPALMWWASAINFLPVQIGAFCAVTTHVLYLRTGKKRYAVLSALSFGFGLMSYVKGLLIPVVLAIMTVSYFANGSVLHRVVSAIRRWWFGWVMYAAIGVIYLALYLTHGEKASPSKIAPDYLSAANDTLVSSLSTGLVGGPWRWLWLGSGMGPRFLSGPPQIAGTVSIIVIVGLLIYAACRSHGALKPLYFIFPFIIVTFLIISSGRSTAFGSGASLDIRYWTDMLPFAALAIALIIMPLRGASDPARPRENPVIVATIPVWAYIAGGLAFLTGSIYSSVTYVEPWHSSFETRQFVVQAAAELSATAVPVEIADQVVPDGVVNAFNYPYNLPSNLFAPLRKHFTTPAVSTDLQTFDPQGHIVPGRVSQGISAPGNLLDVCADGAPNSEPTNYSLGAKTFDFPFWLSISYRSTGSSPITITAGSNEVNGTISAGRHTLFVRTKGVYDSVSLQVDARATVCVDAINVGPKLEAGS